MSAPMDEDPQIEDDMLDADEAAEEIQEDGDHPMDEEDDDENIEADTEIELQNDSSAYFDLHTDSLFAITAHPLNPSIIATGSGDDTAYVFSVADVPRQETRPLPASYESNPQPTQPRQSLKAIAHLTGFSDSVSNLTFTHPDGAYLICAGLDGQIRAYTTAANKYVLAAEAQEVESIEWLIPCPHASNTHTFALGASDGSVWVYSVTDSALNILQTYYQHTGSCTAGAFSASGSLLASVSEDGSLYVYDPFGDAAAAGIQPASGGQALVGLTAADQRFVVEGGLYSVAFAPSGAFLAVGGAGGNIRIIGLPLLAQDSHNATKSQKGAGAAAKGGRGGASKQSGSGQSGQILASLQAQGDGIETLSFAQPPLTLLAAGSVDGSIALFDYAHGYAVRRLIRGAHEEHAVVKVAFAKESVPNAASNWILTSCGMDGVVRRWDARGGTAAAGMGMIKEFHGHRGGGEGGGVMGFVEGNERIVTAGDDSVALVFDVGDI